MKKLIITEEEKNNIISKYYPNSILNEQSQFLRKLFGTSADDIFKHFTDDAVKNVEMVLSRAISNPRNFVVKGNQKFLKSASGGEISLDTIEGIFELVSQGRIQPLQYINNFPRQLADGTEFRSVMKQALESKVASQVVGNFGKRFLLDKCFAHNNCPNLNSILSSFYQKLGNTAKLTNFLPSEVKVLSKEIVAGREVIEVQLKDGTKILFYKSSGSNVGTTGKQAGEWFVIPGFAENGWFFKTAETVNLTKGGNKYLTDMAEFLQMNGSAKLGK